MTLPAVLPGDVLAIRTGGDAAEVIRLGEAMEGLPNLDNHVAVAHHTDAAGTLWLIEARPGGVGWADAHKYDNPYLLTNADQPKTQAQRDQICALAVGMLGVGYDWTAIGMDAAHALHIDGLWRSKAWDSQAPAHVVCSSLAAWLYQRVGLACPTGGRTVTPADWSAWILDRGWEKT